MASGTSNRVMQGARSTAPQQDTLQLSDGTEIQRLCGKDGLGFPDYYQLDLHTPARQPLTRDYIRTGLEEYLLAAAPALSQMKSEELRNRELQTVNERDLNSYLVEIPDSFWNTLKHMQLANQKRERAEKMKPKGFPSISTTEAYPPWFNRFVDNRVSLRDLLLGTSNPVVPALKRGKTLLLSFFEEGAVMEDGIKSTAPSRAVWFTKIVSAASQRMDSSDVGINHENTKIAQHLVDIFEQTITEISNNVEQRDVTHLRGYTNFHLAIARWQYFLQLTYLISREGMLDLESAVVKFMPSFELSTILAIKSTPSAVAKLYLYCQYFSCLAEDIANSYGLSKRFVMLAVNTIQKLDNHQSQISNSSLAKVLASIINLLSNTLSYICYYVPEVIHRIRDLPDEQKVKTNAALVYSPSSQFIDPFKVSVGDESSITKGINSPNFQQPPANRRRYAWFRSLQIQQNPRENLSLDLIQFCKRGDTFLLIYNKLTKDLGDPVQAIEYLCTWAIKTSCSDPLRFCMVTSLIKFLKRGDEVLSKSADVLQKTFIKMLDPFKPSSETEFMNTLRLFGELTKESLFSQSICIKTFISRGHFSRRMDQNLVRFFEELPVPYDDAKYLDERRYSIQSTAKRIDDLPKKTLQLQGLFQQLILCGMNALDLKAFLQELGSCALLVQRMFNVWMLQNYGKLCSGWSRESSSIMLCVLSVSTIFEFSQDYDCLINMMLGLGTWIRCIETRLTAFLLLATKYERALFLSSRLREVGAECEKWLASAGPFQSIYLVDLFNAFWKRIFVDTYKEFSVNLVTIAVKDPGSRPISTESPKELGLGKLESILSLWDEQNGSPAFQNPEYWSSWLQLSAMYYVHCKAGTEGWGRKVIAEEIVRIRQQSDPMVVSMMLSRLGTFLYFFLTIRHIKPNDILDVIESLHKRLDKSIGIFINFLEFVIHPETSVDPRYSGPYLVDTFFAEAKTSMVVWLVSVLSSKSFVSDQIQESCWQRIQELWLQLCEKPHFCEAILQQDNEFLRSLNSKGITFAFEEYIALHRGLSRSVDSSSGDSVVCIEACAIDIVQRLSEWNLRSSALLVLLPLCGKVRLQSESNSEVLSAQSAKRICQTIVAELLACLWSNPQLACSYGNFLHCISSSEYISTSVAELFSQVLLDDVDPASHTTGLCDMETDGANVRFYPLSSPTLASAFLRVAIQYIAEAGMVAISQVVQTAWEQLQHLETVLEKVDEWSGNVPKVVPITTSLVMTLAGSKAERLLLFQNYMLVRISLIMAAAMASKFKITGNDLIEKKKVIIRLSRSILVTGCEGGFIFSALMDLLLCIDDDSLAQTTGKTVDLNTRKIQDAFRKSNRTQYSLPSQLRRLELLIGIKPRPIFEPYSALEQCAPVKVTELSGVVHNQLHKRYLEPTLQSQQQLDVASQLRNGSLRLPADTATTLLQYQSRFTRRSPSNSGGLKRSLPGNVN